MSRVVESKSTLLEPQSHFGDKPVNFRVVCPPKRDCSLNKVNQLFMYIYCVCLYAGVLTGATKAKNAKIAGKFDGHLRLSEGLNVTSSGEAKGVRNYSELGQIMIYLSIYLYIYLSSGRLDPNLCRCDTLCRICLIGQI